MEIYWKDNRLVMELLGEIEKTKNGKFYLKKWSFNNGETWICEDGEILSFEAKSGISNGKYEHIWYNKFNKKYLKENINE